VLVVSVDDVIVLGLLVLDRGPDEGPITIPQPCSSGS
jgi:hypothetical protein